MVVVSEDVFKNALVKRATEAWDVPRAKLSPMLDALKFRPHPRTALEFTDAVVRFLGVDPRTGLVVSPGRTAQEFTDFVQKIFEPALGNFENRYAAFRQQHPDYQGVVDVRVGAALQLVAAALKRHRALRFAGDAELSQLVDAVLMKSAIFSIQFKRDRKPIKFWELQAIAEGGRSSHILSTLGTIGVRSALTRTVRKPPLNVSLDKIVSTFKDIVRSCFREAGGNVALKCIEDQVANQSKKWKQPLVNKILAEISKFKRTLISELCVALKADGASEGNIHFFANCLKSFSGTEREQLLSDTSQISRQDIYLCAVLRSISIVPATELSKIFRVAGPYCIAELNQHPWAVRILAGESLVRLASEPRATLTSPVVDIVAGTADVRVVHGLFPCIIDNYQLENDGLAVFVALRLMEEGWLGGPGAIIPEHRCVTNMLMALNLFDGCQARGVKLTNRQDLKLLRGLFATDDNIAVGNSLLALSKLVGVTLCRQIAEIFVSDPYSRPEDLSNIRQACEGKNIRQLAAIRLDRCSDIESVEQAFRSIK